LLADCAVKADTSMLSRFFRRASRSLIAREQDRPDISRHRKRWRKYQRHIDPSRLVFIDETWAKTYRWRKPSAMPVRSSPVTRPKRLVVFQYKYQSSIVF
jgi:hypothetical protein